MTVSEPPSTGRQSGRFRATLLPAIGILILSWIAACISVHQYGEPDLFWQLRVGHDIVYSGHPPHYETYSWDRYGSRWSVSEWLAFVAYYDAYRWLGGFAGLLDIRILLNVVTVSVQFVALRRLTKSTPIAFMLSCASEIACANFFQTRPYQYTFIFSTVLAYLIAGVRSGSLTPKPLLWVIPLTVAWANLHQGFTLAVAILLVYAGIDAAIGGALLLSGRQEAARSTMTKSRWFAIAGVGAVAASLVSPYGFEPYVMVGRTVVSPISRFIIEWMPLTLDGSLESTALVILAAAIAATVLLSTKRDLATIIVVVVLGVETMLHQRNVPLFALMGPVLVGPAVEDVVVRARRLPASSAGRVRLVVNGLGVAAATWNLVLWTSSAQSVFGTVEADKHATGHFWTDLGNVAGGRYLVPEQAADFVADNGFPTTLHLFNDLGAGGYLIWKLPRYRVFIDGRNDPYFGGILEDYYIAKSAPSCSGFDRKMGRFDFDGAITVDPFIQGCFASKSDWVCVYTSAPGDRTRIYLRRSSRTNALIARCLQKPSMNVGQ